MNKDLTIRTKQLALRVIRLCEALPDTLTARVIAKQLLRSATSVGANYRTACRARSRKDFVSKLELFWKKPMKRSIGWSF